MPEEEEIKKGGPTGDRESSPTDVTQSAPEEEKKPEADAPAEESGGKDGGE